MAIGTVEEFLSVLERGKLLKPEEFTDAQDLAEGVSDPTTLAKTLVRQGLLSRWQAGQLLAGRSTFFLGKYKLIELLGKGGMGSVFLGEHVMMNRLVALKIIPRHVSKDPAGLERFLVEARTIAAVDHPNIVQAYNVDNDGDLYYLVMEYVEGLDLQRLVEAEGPLDCPDAVDCVRQAADGLAHAHARKMVHCDIKPSNLIVNPQGVVKILDMGMARLVGPERLGMDASEQDERIIGSVDYQAPEQALRTVDFDHRADIYSLGCTLYFLLSGHAPFAQGTLAERILKHQTMPPPDLSAERDNVPQSLSDICRKMMAKRPVDRYQSAADVSGMLNDWRPGEQRVQRILSAKKTQLVDELPGPELLGADLSALLRQSMSSSSTSSRRTHVTYERKIWGLPATTLRILLTAGILSLFLILVGIAIFWPFGQSDKSVAIKNIDRTQTKTNTKNTAKVLGSDTEKKTTPFPAADVASKASQPPAAPDLDNLSIPSVP
ncbi:MAG: serine/threonine protein kinase, partial [Thermoguttaceae bacterium]